ncbi:MAG: alpha/beta fold hydrolase [Candidatus Buchananbacteria bacterium]|nr:alpha/beta fold hydrolase [Candidatus Buchananbacteria bacterium]
MERQYDGRELTLGNILAENESYTRHYITYLSGDLKISGIMNVPKGAGPFPVLILNHGYIDPAIYTNGRGLKREQDYLARQGYIVIHPDYRNHAQSDKDPNSELDFRLGYTQDVINAVYAVKNSEFTFFDKDNIGMLGHSMGGGITLNTLVIKPTLIKAAVLFAPVSADYQKNYDKWTRQRREIAVKIEMLYGSPTTSPEFWEGISAINYFDRVNTPIQIHHGTADESVPLAWSDELEAALKNKSKTVEYFVYPNEPHEFIQAWPTVMKRTVEFFDQFLK